MNANINGANLYYEVHGDAEPLLMIQGCGGEISNWQNVIEPLSQNFKLILFDNRGMGRSEVTPGDYTTKNLAADAVGLLEHLQIERAHVLGWSMGGMIAQEIALAYPEKVNKLVLSATAAKFSAKSSYKFRAFIELLKRKEFEALVDWQMSLVFSEQTFANPEATAFTRNAFLNSPYPMRAEGLSSQVAALTAHDRRGQLREIKAATLISGAEEDGFFTVKELQDLTSEIDKAELKIIAGSHLYHAENSAEFSQVVTEFLQK